MRKERGLLLALAFFVMTGVALGQVDPEKRELVQIGFTQAMKGASPVGAYGFYYVNEPDFFATNITLRLALAPVYLDSEVGFAHLLGPHTDLAVGLAGGGFADNYYEYHDGKYQPGESFTGHGAEGSISIYHLFNPGQRIPLFGVLRVKEHLSVYEGGDELDPGFVLPRDHWTFEWRAGLRLGGRDPLLTPDLAMEVSAWYEGQYRTDSGRYGFDGDRVLEARTELFWGRALFIYTLPKSKQSIDFSLSGGASVHADRFSAYRLGGDLPLASEFPLAIPGYFYQELSASSFVSLTTHYTMPLDAAKTWTLCPVASVAALDYLAGLGQPGHLNSGAGLQAGYRSRNGVWQVVATYGYGFQAVRSDGRGGQSVGILCQINLGARHPGGPSELDRVLGYFPSHF
jgi:hypothetical protein